MNRGLKYLAVTSCTVILSLLIIEIVSRIVLQKVYNRDFDSNLIVENKYFSSPGLKENSKGMVWGKLFHTDEFGGRENVSYDRKKKKWLFIGDSVTEGVGVPDSATFSSLCSKEFSEFNVLNYSLIGYSTSDYYNVLKSVILHDTSVELVTLFYCLNDVYGNSKAVDLPVMAKQNFVGVINSFLQRNCGMYKLLKLLVYSNSNRYYQYDSQFYSNEDSHFQESMNYLRQCDSVCKSKNIFFQVVMLPYKSQLFAHDLLEAPQHFVKEFCAQDSIEFSDATTFLAKQRNKKSFYLFADEIHFSAEGQRAIAEFLSE